jgi:hypothetical protein
MGRTRFSLSWREDRSLSESSGRTSKKSPGASPEVKTALRVYFEDNRERNHHLVRELRVLLELFTARGVEALAFKGPTLAQLVYGSLEARQAGDLDFLVRAEDVLDLAPPGDALPSAARRGCGSTRPTWRCQQG